MVLHNIYSIVVSDVTDIRIGMALRKRSRVSKDDVDSTMAEDSDDPYDFTEDENSQIFLPLFQVFLLLHIHHCA